MTSLFSFHRMFWKTHFFLYDVGVYFSKSHSLLEKIRVIVLVMRGRHIGRYVSPYIVCGSGCISALISYGVVGLAPSSLFLSQSERLSTHFLSCLMLIFLIEYVSQPLRDWDTGKEAGRDGKLIMCADAFSQRDVYLFEAYPWLLRYFELLCAHFKKER